MGPETPDFLQSAEQKLPGGYGSACSEVREAQGGPESLGWRNVRLLGRSEGVPEPEYPHYPGDSYSREASDVFPEGAGGVRKDASGPQRVQCQPECQRASPGQPLLSLPPSLTLLLFPLQPQVYAPPRPTDRLAVPPFVQRSRFQPTYPYLQQEIALPPTISLSDGEEPPPYQGPCTLQLRDPEQQLELNRESVRAPPNRTIFDSDLMDSTMLGGPCPPSSNSGISATCYSSGGRMEGPPPTYNEVIGHYPGSSFQHQQSNGPPSLLEGTRLHHPHIAPLENKEKEKQKGHPL
ncbi:hypothetical protein STEG23_014946 [Scotinomys teguina]